MLWMIINYDMWTDISAFCNSECNGWLFAGVSLPEVDYENLRFAIIDNCMKANLQPLESFITKTIQLYEMIIVRHGLMLVGYSFGMKTSSWR